MELKIVATEVFEKNYDALFNADERFIVNIGGSRSSKTYSICQLIVVYALNNPGKVISIVRKSFPSLRATVMRDFFEVMNLYGLYEKQRHNKTENIYTFDNGTIVEFFSLDDEQKVRGRKRDLCFCNEANELFYDDMVQLNMRTIFKMIFDFNPSESNSWLYELDDAITIESSFLDNPFLEKSIKQQILALKHKDPELWTIYGLGKRATSRINVYQHFKKIDLKPERFKDDSFVYGLDFGYNHPTALIKVYYHEDEIYVEELIYESYLTTPEIIQRMKDLGIDKKKKIVADHARPEIIEEIKRAGFNITGADKSVKKGIDDVKSLTVYVDSLSRNVLKEYENYKYKKIGDKITDEVIKLWDDALDALRYACRAIKKDSFKPSRPAVRIG